MEAIATPAPGDRAHPLRPYLDVALAALLFAAVAALIQFHFTSFPQDEDTAYHVAVGWLIREHGLLKSFPWTPFSWLAENYADKELLFHLLFVPLAGFSWVTAAKIVGTISGAAALLALYLVLRAEKVRLAWLWALLPLLASDVFIYRFALVRPHLLSIALAVVALWAAVRGRLVVLAVASAVYPWAYVAWQLPLVLVAIAEAARVLSGERLRWRPAAAALAGLAVGIAVHPNAVNLVRFNWVVLADILVGMAWRGGGEDLTLGSEFDPFTAAQWARWLLACAAMTVAAVAVAWRERKAGSLALAFALAALAFGALTVRTARFAEYFIPFSAAALALAARSVRWRWMPAAVAAGCLAYTAVPASETLQGLGLRREFIPAPLAAQLRERIPVGAQVFTCDWGVTGTLMLALPDRKFMVALDPTLFYLKDPERFRLWMRLQREGPPGTAAAIRETFGARYVACFWDDSLRKLTNRLAFEPGVSTLLVTDDWNVYDLGGGG
jgi:hypothetical protein